MGSGKSDEIQAKQYFQGEIGLSPLVNKLNLSNQDKLDIAEAYYVEITLQNGLSAKAKELSPTGLKQMHRELFGEIYEWAGAYRTYTTGRGSPFCRPEFIEKETEKLYQKLNEKLRENINKDDFIKTSAWFIGELNSIHPFIDGNGRTQRLTLDLIAEKSGFDINVNLLNKEDWYKSAEQCHLYAKYDGFEQIISSLIIEQEKTLEEKLSTEQKTAVEAWRRVIDERFKGDPAKRQEKHDALDAKIPSIVTGEYKIEAPTIKEEQQIQVQTRDKCSQDRGI